MSEATTVVLEVDRGNLVVTIRALNSQNVFFFKYHHQPIDQHPEQVQHLVRLSKPTIRTKSIKVDIQSFITQYYNVSEKVFEFRGVPLNSTNQQVSKVMDRRINKEVGILKRKKTVEERKDAKTAEKNKKFLEKLASDEAKFQEERAKRIAAAKADMDIDL